MYALPSDASDEANGSDPSGGHFTATSLVSNQMIPVAFKMTLKAVVGEGEKNTLALEPTSISTFMGTFMSGTAES